MCLYWRACFEIAQGESVRFGNAFGIRNTVNGVVMEWNMAVQGRSLALTLQSTRDRRNFNFSESQFSFWLLNFLIALSLSRQHNPWQCMKTFRINLRKLNAVDNATRIGRSSWCWSMSRKEELVVAGLFWQMWEKSVKCPSCARCAYEFRCTFSFPPKSSIHAYPDWYCWISDLVQCQIRLKW